MANSRFSSGKVAGFICDKCRMSYPYTRSMFDGAFPGLRVCPECYDFLSPYLFPPMQPDAFYLRYPRPYVKLVAPQYQNVPVYDGGPISTGNVVPETLPDDPLFAENYEYVPPSARRRGR